jgi:hypothetical protein
MNETGTLHADEGIGMKENRYSLAGWLAIVQGILLVVAGASGAMFLLMGMSAGGPRVHHLLLGAPILLLKLIIAVMFIYVMLKFRAFLHERFEFKRVDGLLIILILLFILNMVSGLGGGALSLLGMQTGGPLMHMYMTDSEASPHLLPSRVPGLWSLMGFSVWALLNALATGIVFLILGLRLRRMQEEARGPLKIFAYLTLGMGILSLSIVLSPLASLLMPVWCVLLGLIFLREDEALPDFV